MLVKLTECYFRKNNWSFPGSFKCSNLKLLFFHFNRRTLERKESASGKKKSNRIDVQLENTEKF